MSASNIVSKEGTGSLGDKESLQEVLDFLVTEEQLGVTLVSAAIENAGKAIGPPNDVGFENFDWPTLGAVREALEALGIGYGVETSQPGRFYQYPGDPLANGVGTPVNHTQPR
jgi:hypothetical protein